MRLRTVIADDEPVALLRLARLLEAEGSVEVVGTAATGTEAARLVAALKPDLLMLDIEMPGQSGLEMAAGLDPANSPVVIFITAFSQYALEAFGLDSADYLLKPIEFNRLEAALSRAARRIAERTAADREVELRTVIDALRSRLVTDQDSQHIWIQDGRANRRLSLATIHWLAAEGDYVRIHTEARTFLVRGYLRDFQARLPAGDFHRVHRSAIVRRASVAWVRRRGDRTLVLTLVGGEEIRVSRSFSGGIHQWAGLFSK